MLQFVSNGLRCLGHGSKVKQQTDLVTKYLQLIEKGHKQREIDTKHKFSA